MNYGIMQHCYYHQSAYYVCVPQSNVLLLLHVALKINLY